MSDRKVFSLRDGLRDLFVRPAFHEPVIDGVRAIAVLWVLLFHCWFFQSPHWTNGISVPMFDVINSSAGWTWLKEGQFGVDFFFVISGFLIGTILFKELARTDTLNLKRFYARRFLRLIPVYVAAMAIGYFCGLKNAETAWANLLYVNNFLPIDQQYMGWCWSLAIEEQFYCVAPLLLLFAWKRRGGFLVGSAVLLVVGWGIRLYVTHASGLEFLYEWPDIQTDNPGWVRRFSVVYDNFYTRYGGLLIGVMAAWMHTKHGGALARFFEARSGLATVLTLAGVEGFCSSLASTSASRWTSRWRSGWLTSRRTATCWRCALRGSSSRACMGASPWLAAFGGSLARRRSIPSPSSRTLRT